MTTSTRAVVIGTGAGGLAAAAYLAKRGFDVTALEQAEQVGGLLAPFRREGFEFNPGVHYVGGCRAGDMVHRALAGVGIDATALFCELDPEGFDVYRFPELEIRMCRGEEAYRHRLTEAFPADARGIARLFHTASAVQTAFGTMTKLQSDGLGALRIGSLWNLPTVLRWSSHTFGELLGSMLSEPRARAVVAAPCGDYGLPPSRGAALAGLSLLSHYLNGAFFPRGGSGALRDALAQATSRSGGRFRTGARVAKILTRDGRAVGVELADGERIDAEVIVSDADPVVTLGRLIEPGILPARLIRRVRETEPSMATFTVFLGMRRDVAARGMGRFNVWDYPSWDIEEAYAAPLRGELPRDPALFLSPNSLKDDSHALAPAGGSTLEVTTFVPYAIFARWRDLPMGARGEAYESEKRRIADWMLAAVERRWPGLVGDVAVEVLSSPLTNESYTGAVQGGAYGPAMTPAQSGTHRFHTATPVPNLFLAGAGVFGDGVAACITSGRVAAALAARALAAPRTRARPGPRHAHA